MLYMKKNRVPNKSKSEGHRAIRRAVFAAKKADMADGRILNRPQTMPNKRKQADKDACRGQQEDQ